MLTFSLNLGESVCLRDDQVTRIFQYLKSCQLTKWLLCSYDNGCCEVLAE